MKKLKNTILLVAVAIIVVLMAATFIESRKGTPFAAQNIYGTPWFVALWAALAALSLAYILKRKLFKRLQVCMLHLSFVVILLGALASWLTAESGQLHLRIGESTNRMLLPDGETSQLGFSIKLKAFRIDYYPGTDAPMDYVSELSADGGETISISMNNIGQHAGYRFTQSGYDSDMQGTTLGVYHDPWGIGITYVGYALLFLSIILVLFGNKTRMLQYYRQATANVPVGAKALMLTFILALQLLPASMRAQESVKISKDFANEFGKLCALSNSRISPVNTIATNFVAKLSGRTSWDGLNANQVFAGWVFDVPYWEGVKMIEIKDKKAQEVLGLHDKWASFNDFFNEYNEYKLEKPMQEATSHGDKKMISHLRDADEKYNIIRMLYNGEMLKVFPYTNGKGRVEWYAPGQSLVGVHLDEKELTFVSKSMDYLAESVIMGDAERANVILKKIYNYQHVRGQKVIPSKFRIGSEIFYNTLNTQRWPTMLYLTLALLLIIGSTLGERVQKRYRMLLVGKVLTAVMLLHTTALLILRWYVSGHLPMSNGFETMQFMAWATLLLSLCLHKIEPVRQFGPLLAAFALLVAMITDSNPQLTQLMPVLQSPLLSMHVMVIMFSYALFGLMALIAIEGMLAAHKGNAAKTEQLASLSRFLLYPAVGLLAIGIFVGAIWANVSWGRYWSWDSKETWALITMLIYAAPLHADVQWLRKPLNLHAYVLIAFLSVLMTYFGVNYFLAGMHSYA